MITEVTIYWTKHFISIISFHIMKTGIIIPTFYTCKLSLIWLSYMLWVSQLINGGGNGIQFHVIPKAMLLSITQVLPNLGTSRTRRKRWQLWGLVSWRAWWKWHIFSTYYKIMTWKIKQSVQVILNINWYKSSKWNISIWNPESLLRESYKKYHCNCCKEKLWKWFKMSTI